MYAIFLNEPYFFAVVYLRIHSSTLRDNKNGDTTFSSVLKVILDNRSLASFSNATFLRIARKQTYKANSFEIEKLNYALSLFSIPSLTKFSEYQLDREKLRIEETRHSLPDFPTISTSQVSSCSLCWSFSFIQEATTMRLRFFPLRTTS